MSEAIRIYATERYPVYIIEDRYGYEFDVAPADLERWNNAIAQYDAVQEELGDLHEAAEVEANRVRAEEKAAREADEKAKQLAFAREREKVRREQEAANEAMWARLEATGGKVYDAEGRELGTIQRGVSGQGLIRP